MFATDGVELIFDAVKEEMFPEPFAARPIPGFEFIHVYKFPVPTNDTAFVNP